MKPGDKPEPVGAAAAEILSDSRFLRVGKSGGITPFQRGVDQQRNTALRKRACGSSFAPQCVYGIHPGGTARRQVAGNPSSDGNQDDDAAEHERIRAAGLVEQ